MVAIGGTKPLAFIVFGGSVIALPWLLAAFLEPLVDAAWFGLGGATFGDSTAWLSIAIASATSCAVFAVCARAIPTARTLPLVGWAVRYLTFATLFYSLVSATFFMLVEAASDSLPWRTGTSENSFHIVQILLISSHAALLWVLVFRVHDYGGAAARIFVLGVVGLAVTFLLSDPSALAEAITVFQPHVYNDVSPTGVPRSHCYVAPLAPLLWSAWQYLRSIHGRRGERSFSEPGQVSKT